VIRCPLCRQDFGPIDELKQIARENTRRTTHAERNLLHLGTTCNGCHSSPIQGTCFKCCMCARYFLCSTCFTHNIHNQHRFEMRDAPTARWKPALRETPAALPPQLAAVLQQRDLTDDDYHLLLALDSTGSGVLPLEVVNRRFPAAPAPRDNTAPCGICTGALVPGNPIRTLQCRHVFHVGCIDPWLTTQRNTCPVDGLTACVNDGADVPFVPAPPPASITASVQGLNVYISNMSVGPDGPVYRSRHNHNCEKKINASVYYFIIYVRINVAHNQSAVRNRRRASLVAPAAPRPPVPLMIR
jgi:hypothetical protein